MKIQIEQAMEKVETENNINWTHKQLKQHLQIEELEWIPKKQIVRKTDYPFAIFQYEARVLDPSITRNDLIDMIVEIEDELLLREESWI